MRKILVINFHPNKDSFCLELSDAYVKGATKPDNEIQVINICDLNFNPNLAFGYQQRTELEPDLLVSWEKIK